MDRNKGRDMDEIRAALIPPIPYKRIPGYCLLMKVEDGLLTFTAEAGDDNWVKLMSIMLDLERSFRYCILYTVMESRDRIADSYFRDLYKRAKEEIPWIKIMPAPYASDIPQGIALFTETMTHGKFVMPPESSILFGHIGQLQADALPDDDCYAFHALRYILGGLSIQPVIDVKQVAEGRIAWINAQKRNKLTGMSKAAWDELDVLKQEQKRKQED